MIGAIVISTLAVAQPITPVNLQTGTTIQLPAGAVANDVVVINADGDTRPDLLVPLQGLNDLRIYIQPTLQRYGLLLTPNPSQQPLSVLAMNFTTGSRVSPPSEFVVLTADGNVTPWRPDASRIYRAGTPVPLRGGLACAATDRLVSGNYEVGNGADLACLSNGPQPGIARLANRGNGVFLARPQLARPQVDSALVLTTIDLDDDFDLLEEALVPRRNDPAGSFSIYPHIGGLSSGVIWWTFSQAPTLTAGGPGPVLSLAAADINGDTFPDVVLAAADGAAAGFIYVRRFLNNTAPLTFQAPLQTLAVQARPREVRLADLNGDGRPELLVLGQNGSLYAFTNISRLGTTVFDPTPLVLRTGTDPAIMRVADADGDGDLDVIVPCRGDGTVRVFYNGRLGLATATPGQAATCSVYPNPAQTAFQVSWTGMHALASARLFDLTGRCIRYWEADDLKREVSVADLPRGLYLLRLGSAEGILLTRRIELR